MQLNRHGMTGGPDAAPVPPSPLRAELDQATEQRRADADLSQVRPKTRTLRDEHAVRRSRQRANQSCRATEQTPGRSQ